MGFVYYNPTARWASAPHLVPKANADEWRFTGDLRNVNRQTIPIKFPLPNVEHELSKAAGCKYFATFDMTQGYWQLKLDKDSQESQSIITPDGIFTPTRVLHGTCNANAHLHSAFMRKMTTDLLERLMIWVDDMALCAPTPQDLLEYISKLFSLCRELNFKLHPEKCVLFCTSVTWCGRTISEHGIKFDPRNIDGLINMRQPENASELMQFTSALQWVRTSIPAFSELTQPLLDAIETASKMTKNRTKRALQRVKLSDIGWSDEQIQCFNRYKDALRQ